MLDKPIIIGCDEVGYGSLAGPLVVVGVRAPKDWAIPGLRDSKQLSPKQREVMQTKLLQNRDIDWHLASRSNDTIDEHGVAATLKDAYVECFHALYQPDCLIISDGNLKFDGLGVDAYDKVSIVKADTKIPSVMAASILAKTYRDAIMKTFHLLYPIYGWDHNVGYAAKDHLQALEKYGACRMHRFSYAPMKHMKDRALYQGKV